MWMLIFTKKDLVIYSRSMCFENKEHNNYRVKLTIFYMVYSTMKKTVQRCMVFEQGTLYLYYVALS